jgi:hypothetical protein
LQAHFSVLFKNVSRRMSSKLSGLDERKEALEE